MVMERASLYLGSLASRLVLAVLALLLGWLAPLHAGGPSPVATDDVESWTKAWTGTHFNSHTHRITCI